MRNWLMRFWRPEKSHDLPSASWRSRTAGSVIRFESEGLGPRAAGGVNPSLRAGEDERKGPAQAANQEKRGKFLLFLPFALFTLLDGAHPHRGGQAT